MKTHTGPIDTLNVKFVRQQIIYRASALKSSAIAAANVDVCLWLESYECTNFFVIEPKSNTDAMQCQAFIQGS